MKKSNKFGRRILAITILTCFITVFTLSSVFIISHANHRCTGHNCPICAQIKICVSSVHNLNHALGTASSTIFSHLLFILCSILGVIVTIYFQRSLVSLKVRLDI